MGCWPGMKMKRILFVDDEPHVLDGLRRMFRTQRQEWQMSFANSGKEALAILGTAAFDVIVTDMRMPEMDGGTLLERVREAHPSVIRIVLSGHVETEAALRTAAVAQQFLSKPCDPGRLREAIEKGCNCAAKLNNGEVHRVVGAIGTLPPLPSTGASLLGALQDPDVDLARIARIIERDVGIAAKILQLANSAFFGLPNEVASVQGAVSCLGLETIKHLVLSVEIRRTFHPCPAYAAWLVDFEAHCRLSASIAARLPVPRGSGSTAVVAALLHDTGKLILANRLPEKFRLVLRTAAEESVPLHMAEQQVTSVNHAQVGAHLFELWGLPETLVKATRGHHQPTTSHGNGLDILGATHVADALAHEVKGSRKAGASPEDDLLDMAYIEALGLADQLSAWRAAAREVTAVGL